MYANCCTNVITVLTKTIANHLNLRMKTTPAQVEVCWFADFNWTLHDKRREHEVNTVLDIKLPAYLHCKLYTHPPNLLQAVHAPTTSCTRTRCKLCTLSAASSDSLLARFARCAEPPKCTKWSQTGVHGLKIWQIIAKQFQYVFFLFEHMWTHDNMVDKHANI